MKLQKRRRITLIFGRTGSGKSELTKKLIQKENRLIILDPQQEYIDGVIFYALKDLAEYLLNKQPHKFKIICRFSSDQEIEKLFDLVYYLKKITLVVEEAEIYISRSAQQSNFLRLVRYGRHTDISIIAIARRAVELSTDIKAQANEIYSFKQILSRDIDYFQDLGFKRVDSLKLYEFERVEF